ncbi:MAG TPA: hydroxymyristoyl-ACP dehydratase [Xanthomonadales bacterium]|nr:hydroxymyristoyl-ACP dehydratase [Xanthomonadales bacterium]
MNPGPARACFTIDPGHPSLAGHFPGNPVVPGVLLLDEVVCAALRLLGGEAALLAIPQVKFVSPLRPGVEAEITLERGDRGVRFAVSAAGTAIAQGVLELGVRA